MTPAYDKKRQIYHYTAVKVAKMFVAFKFQISSFIQEIVRYQKKGGKLLLMLRKLIVSYLLTLLILRRFISDAEEYLSSTEPVVEMDVAKICSRGHVRDSYFCWSITLHSQIDPADCPSVMDFACIQLTSFMK